VPGPLTFALDGQAQEYGRQAMKIEGQHCKWHAQDEATIQQVLEFRDEVGGAVFWLARDDARYPTLAIRISGDMADVHYFPHEGHPGFRALAEPSVREGQPTNFLFIYEGCDPATGEETPSEFVIPLSTAIALAKEFHRSGARSSAVSWFEL